MAVTFPECYDASKLRRPAPPLSGFRDACLKIGSPGFMNPLMRLRQGGFLYGSL